MKQRLLDAEQDFFKPIKRNSLHTGLKKKKVTNKKIDVQKEDRQAFGHPTGI